MSLSRAHRGAVFLGVLVTVALAAAPAVAAPATVDVRNGSFAPGDVTVAAGETVTWSWSGSGHDVKLGGAEAFTTPFNDAGATYVHRFTTPGTYSYVCEAHAAMKGRVVVTAATPGAPAPASAPAPAPAPAGPPPRVAALRTSPTGALVRFTLSSPAKVRADVTRWTPGGWRHVARTEARGAGGRTVLRWTTGAIARGRYRVAVVAFDDAGRRSATASRGFRVRRPVPAAAGARSSPGAAAPAGASPAPSPGAPAPTGPPAPTPAMASPQPADAVSPQGQGPAPVDGGGGDGGGGGPGPG